MFRDHTRSGVFSTLGLKRHLDVLDDLAYALVVGSSRPAAALPATGQALSVTYLAEQNLLVVCCRCLRRVGIRKQVMEWS